MSIAQFQFSVPFHASIYQLSAVIVENDILHLATGNAKSIRHTKQFPCLQFA